MIELKASGLLLSYQPVLPDPFFFIFYYTTTRWSTTFRTPNCFRHEQSGALKTCMCRDASAGRTLCLYIYLFICWLRLLGPAEHKIASQIYYSHGRFIISIETGVCNSGITQLSGNKVKHEEGKHRKDVCLSRKDRMRECYGKKNNTLCF